MSDSKSETPRTDALTGTFYMRCDECPRPHECEQLKSVHPDDVRLIETELSTTRVELERVKEGLRWYADGNHYELPGWDEEEGWLCPPTDDSLMVEPGNVARAVLGGAFINPDEEADEITIAALHTAEEQEGKP